MLEGDVEVPVVGEVAVGGRDRQGDFEGSDRAVESAQGLGVLEAGFPVVGDGLVHGEDDRAARGRREQGAADQQSADEGPEMHGGGG